MPIDSDMEGDTILEVKNLRKEYREFALRDISLSLPKGSIMGIIGPNGAGKTTTIKIIMNMLQAKSGDVRLFGLNYKQHEREIKNRIGYVGEEQYFYQNKTIRWTEKFVSAFYRDWDSDLFARLLEEFQLTRTKKVKELSKGMKVKLSFAVALSHHPDLLILDEPTAGLDPVIRREILDLLLTKSQDEDKSVILSSHITDDITRIADYIAFMINGRIEIADTKDHLLSNWKKIHFKNGTLTDEIGSKLLSISKQMFGSAGLTDRYLALRPLLEKGIGSQDIVVENVNLDDILISLVKEN